MRSGLAFILFLCFAKLAFAQKDEVKRYVIINSEKVDSAYLKSILIEIYSETIKGNILAYNDYKFEEQLGIEEVKKIGGFCEWVIILDDEESCSGIDSFICIEADPDNIETFSLKFESYIPLPKSLSVELFKFFPEIKDNDFWVNFSDLHKILDEKQISYLLNSTSFLPSETLH